MFTSVSRVVPEYESSWMMISAQMRTRQRVVVVRHCVTVAFLTLFLCMRNVGRPYQLDGGSHCHGKVICGFVKTYIPFLKDAFPGCAELVLSH